MPPVSQLSFFSATQLGLDMSDMSFQSRFAVKKSQKSSNFPSKLKPKWGLGPIWSEDGSGEAKKGAQGQNCQPILEVIFEVFEHLLQCNFLRFFRKAFFSILRRLLSAQGPEKGAESKPKWRPKRVWRHSLGSVKSMAGAVFSTH